MVGEVFRVGVGRRHFDHGTQAPERQGEACGTRNQKRGKSSPHEVGTLQDELVLQYHWTSHDILSAYVKEPDVDGFALA